MRQDNSHRPREPKPVIDRERRTKARRLRKSLAFIPEHKRPLAESLIDIALDGSITEARRAIDRLLSLVSDPTGSSSNQGPDILSNIRSLEHPSNYTTSSDLGQTPTPKGNPGTLGGRLKGMAVPRTSFKGSLPQQQVIDGRSSTLTLPTKPLPWRGAKGLAEHLHEKVREYGIVNNSPQSRFTWNTLGKSDRQFYDLIATDLYRELDNIWPKEIPAISHPQSPGTVRCEACDGTGWVPRALRVALNWFLAARAKKARKEGKYYIRKGDWGYEEIAAVELCDYYRNKEDTMVLVEFWEAGGSHLELDRTSKFHPDSIVIERYPTEAQLKRGMLELKEKQKRLSGADKAVLTKIRKHSKLRGPTMSERDGVWHTEWGGRGVASRIVHKSSGLATFCESFSNFKQNRAAAESELEKMVQSWFESSTQNDVEMRATTEKS